MSIFRPIYSLQMGQGHGYYGKVWPQFYIQLVFQPHFGTWILSSTWAVWTDQDSKDKKQGRHGRFLAGKDAIVVATSPARRRYHCCFLFLKIPPRTKPWLPWLPCLPWLPWFYCQRKYDFDLNWRQLQTTTDHTRPHLTTADNRRLQETTTDDNRQQQIQSLP